MTSQVAAGLPLPLSASAGADRMARAHYGSLLRTALRLAGSEAEAADLVQDTFERALRRPGTFETEILERAFLHSILHNAFLDRCRRRAVRNAVSDEELEAHPVESMPEAPPWASISAEQLERAITALDDDFQRVYRMHAIDQRSYKEIADVLSIPLNTVGTRLARARQKLKSLLIGTSGSEGGGT